jgi:geranylgeranyl reductase family protein
MRTRDVIVVGGGPAGSSCAWALRRAGAQVEVWDRKTFPRDKICAGWITPAVVSALALDLDTYVAAGNTLQPIYGFRVGLLGSGDVRVTYRDPISYGIRRCEFDHYLLQRSGAVLRLGEGVRALRRTGSEWVINDSVRARFLVGAGGHFCPVARHLGAQVGQREPVVSAQEVEFRLPPPATALTVEPEVPEILFTPDLKGYGWVFRKGRFLNVGLGRQDHRRLAAHVSDFVSQVARRGKVPQPLPAGMHGHPYLLYDQTPRPLGEPGVLLAGDAAGLAYPKSGEGIRPAVESGLLAAQTIVAGVNDEARFALYEQRIGERMGSRAGSWSVTDWFPESLVRRAAARLFTQEWFVRRVILDQWFLHRRLPPMPAPGKATDTAENPAILAACSRSVRFQIGFRGGP